MRSTPLHCLSARLALVLLLSAGNTGHTELQSDTTALPLLPSEAPHDARPDWLLDPTPYRANLYRTSHPQEIALANGLVRRTFRLQPNVATVALDRIDPPESLLRGVKPEAIVTLNGHRFSVGGLNGQPNYAYLLPEWLGAMTADSGAFQFVGYEVNRPQARFPWLSTRHHAPDSHWPPAGVHLRLEFAPPAGQLTPAVRVSVHYELYDGIPLFSKWIEVHNGSDHPLTVDTFTSELLAVVEHSSWVESSEAVPFEVPESLHVETDYAFGGFNFEHANRFMVHWQPDPQYETQVNYLRRQPCLLLVEPPAGPAQDLAAGQTFSSCRAYELIHDSTERERRGLSVRRMYRTIAPWVTENPLMHHLTTSDPERVRAAIDQANQVGFEMIILSFGSGFDMENEDPKFLAAWHDVAAYAAAKGIDLGAYSLYSSRSIGNGQDIACPPGQSPAHGNCPALTSTWGQNYLRKLNAFFDITGFKVLEHDGPYPGDVDVTPRPPLQKGELDSQWVHWRLTTQFYQSLRARGVYLNAPDYYYLAGSNKCGMGYREVNWSLPRDMQVIHTRQNIYDATWAKTPSMGWMFVPLTEYHGGGPAATIEPLHEHLAHYEQIMLSNLALGVQACYRGPRLFDTAATETMVRRTVTWFKQYREILESDMIHGRRADGKNLDWFLHVRPGHQPCGMLVVFNPTATAQEQTLDVDLYYTGLTDQAHVQPEGKSGQSYTLSRDHHLRLPVNVPARSMGWFLIK